MQITVQTENIYIFVAPNIKNESMETMIVQVRDKRDVRRLMQISEENGWQAQSRNQMLKWLIDTAPKNVPLNDDDIMAEIRSVRAIQ